MKNLINVLKLIWNFLNSRVFVIILIVLVILFLAGQCKRIVDQNREIFIHEQNISALTDSLKFEKIKNGGLLVSIDGYIATEKELKTLNKGLWDKVQAQDGKIISLNHVLARIQQDSAQLKEYINELETIIGQLQEIDSVTYVAPWTLAFSYDSLNYDTFVGKTTIGVLNKNPLQLRHINTQLLGRNTQIDLIWGQKQEKGKLRVFVQSSYPGFTVKSMEGVLIDPNNNPIFKDIIEKKHWFNGWNVGIGITPGFDVMDGKWGITIGPSISWSIYNW